VAEYDFCPNCFERINLETDVYRKDTEIENDIRTDIYCKKCNNKIIFKN
jgi:hypothetical protein